MHTSDPSAEGASPAPGAESSAPVASSPEPAAPSDANAEANGPAIELGLETVELSEAEAAAVASPPGAEADAGPGATAAPLDALAAGGEAPVVLVPASALPGVGLPVAAPADPYVPSSWFLGITAFVVAAADIGSKEWAKWALAGPELKRSAKHIEVIPGHLDFIFAQNPGGAWSFLRSVPDGIRRPFFLFVSAAAIVFIVSVYGRLERRQWAMRWGLPLALGGAIGNLVDRMRYGWVVDFIDAYYKGGANEVHWPTFNVADVAIVFGVALMALDLLSLRRSHLTTPSPRPAETAGGAA